MSIRAHACPGWRLISWEYAGAQPAQTIVIGRAPGRRRSCCWCCLHRCGPVHRLSHRRPFILRQLAEFPDRYRPRNPWHLAGPGQRRAVHRPWPGTAVALGPQAASRRAGQQVNPRSAGLARRHPRVPAHNQPAAFATGSRHTVIAAMRVRQVGDMFGKRRSIRLWPAIAPTGGRRAPPTALACPFDARAYAAQS
jgi:hypothetical protein